MTEPQERVRIEFVAAVEIDARGVVAFVQELGDVPEDAWCEVQSTWSRPVPASSSLASTSPWQTTAQLQCDRSVVDFLCKRFSKPVRYTSRGEVMTVRCRRVHHGTWTRASEGPAVSTTKLHAVEQREPSDGDAEEIAQERPKALPRTMVIDLLDCLGDDIARVHDVFMAHAEGGGGGGGGSTTAAPRLTLLGVCHALEQLW
ncbi:hypothetical protein PINS_up000725 [Pythium insidiosum]|nr:hypothetical protein PINS_up000725 [Pythium insidiosum]